MLKESSCGCDSQSGGRYYTLTVQSPAGTAGADGHVDLTSDSNWTTQGTIKAKFVSKGGREFVQANQVQGEISHTIETASSNFSRGILPKWRLVFGSRIIQITAAYDEHEARQRVIIQGTEKV